VVWKMGRLLSSSHGRSKRIKSGKSFLLGKHPFWTYSKKDIYYMNAAHVSTSIIKWFADGVNVGLYD
jgi:hypothetical protein